MDPPGYDNTLSMTEPPSFDKTVSKMEPPSFDKTMSKMCLNVGGLRHEVMEETLKNLPESRLGKLALASNEEQIRGLCDFFVPLNNEYFFDHSSKSFDQILTLYRTGKLHMNEDLCVLSFIDDLKYWGIDSALLEACCREKFEERKESANHDLENNVEKEEFKSGTCCFSFWKFLEDPTSSCVAKVFSWFSLAMILLSLVVMTLNTVPSIMFADGHGSPMGNPVLSRLGDIIIYFWTVEILVRFIACPNKCQFVKHSLNIIDFLVIVFYFISLFVSDFDFDVSAIMAPMVTLKLARYSAGVRTFAFTLWKSGREFRLVFSLMIMGALIFGSIVFYIERDEDTGFVHLGQAYYWAIITMTTLGYGDMYPETGFGKLFAMLCVIFGILCLALPIPLIISNFTKLYKDQIKSEKMKNEKKGVCMVEAKQKESNSSIK